jgi:hypothetical protein
MSIKRGIAWAIVGTFCAMAVVLFIASIPEFWPLYACIAVAAALVWALIELFSQ